MAQYTISLGVTKDHAIPINPPPSGTATVQNVSGSVLSYADDEQITVDVGTVSASASQQFSTSVWIRSAGFSTVLVTFVDGTPSGGGGSVTITSPDGSIAVGGSTSSPTVQITANQFDALGAASGAITGHIAATDPHGDRAFNQTVLENGAAQTGDYTFVIGDLGLLVPGSKATNQTFTIPPHSSVAFPVGAILEWCQMGAGTVTVAAGVGVTLRGSRVVTAEQYAEGRARQRAQDEWVVSGNLV